MEEEEDDFYGGHGAGAQQHEAAPGVDNAEEDVKEEQMDVEDAEEEEEDEDDVEFTLEKPEGVKSEPARPSLRPTPSHDRTNSADVKLSKATTPGVKQEAQQRASSTAPPPAVKGALTHNGKEGKDFPDIRTSKLDMNSIPHWPGNDKPITELDIDADLAEHSKPWRLPGTDQTDFFNYGFDEYTWTQYCIKQQSMAQTINDQKAADAQMKAMFGGGPPGVGPGAPPGMPPGPPGGGGMPGMPDMEQMMQQMMSQGMNPGNMNFEQFAQMMGGMPGMPPQGPQGQQQMFPGQGGGFGSGQNSVSPGPGAGQGFQPPQGPGMEGYSAQQLAMLQQEQGGGMGGGRGRGRRGRGFY